MRELPRKQCTDPDEGLTAKQAYMQHVAASIVAGLYLMHARELGDSAESDKEDQQSMCLTALRAGGKLLSQQAW